MDVLLTAIAQTSSTQSLSKPVSDKHSLYAICLPGMETKKWKCVDCSFRAQYPSLVRYHHQAVHLKEKAWICKECNQSFSHFPALTNHRNEVHKGTVYNCKLCDETFTKYAKLAYHRRRVHKPRPSLNCKICGQHFISKAGYEYHMKRVHTTDYSHTSCPHCHHCFKNAEYLKTHLKMYCRVVVNEDRVTYSCSKCHKKFRSPSGHHMHEARCKIELPLKVYRASPKVLTMSGETKPVTNTYGKIRKTRNKRKSPRFYVSPYV
jgi:hypothetical protein